MYNYNEAHNKVIDAYFKDEIQPYDGNFCLCGNLSSDCAYSWAGGWNLEYYSEEEYRALEYALLSTIAEQTLGGKDIYYIYMDQERLEIINHPNYEDALFNGMAKGLEVLREIHIKRGEDVDGQLIPQFAKRQLIGV
jgi:hypothetical protein